MWKTGEKKKYSKWKNSLHLWVLRKGRGIGMGKNSLHLWVLGKGRGMGREEQATSTPVGTREGEGDG